jgi:hypothetical protein
MSGPPPPYPGADGAYPPLNPAYPADPKQGPPPGGMQYNITISVCTVHILLLLLLLLLRILV